MQDSIEWVSPNSCVKSLGINFYLFLPTHLSTILFRKHGLISKSTSKRYYQVVILFSRLFCLVLVSIDYKLGEQERLKAIASIAQKNRKKSGFNHLFPKRQGIKFPVPEEFQLLLLNPCRYSGLNFSQINSSVLKIVLAEVVLLILLVHIVCRLV